MKEAEMVFIPFPVIGHIVSAVNTALLLVERDNRFSTSVIVIKPVIDSKTTDYLESLAASTLPRRMRLIDLPVFELQSFDDNWLTYMIEGQKPHVREYVSKIKTQSELSPDSPRLAGFVFDMLCTGMKDLAFEFGVPWYVFFPSSAAFLGCMLHFQALHDEQQVDLIEFNNSDVELEIPSFVNPLPAKLLPSMALDRKSLDSILDQARRWREASGILANTFIELESYTVNSLSRGKIPPVYPVGPIVQCKEDGNDVGLDRSNDYRDIMQWLDDRPPSSVIFLCFGSWGSFSVDQVKEIACALEHSGHQFLWCLRKPPPKGKIECPSDYVYFQEILPEGFLDRTIESGKVIGWAPQAEILAHKSVGGFVSHCGWNSTLESIWFGVPIATWPVYAEQQLNAFQMVIELKLAVELKMDYKKDLNGDDDDVIVSANDIEKGIRCVMEQDSEIRKKVKEMSQISRKVLEDGGSSYSSLGDLIEDVMNNMA